jgi:transposase
MFIRIAQHRSAKKTYRHIQIAESYRDPAKGNEPRTRILYKLGSLEELGEEQIMRLAEGLMKAIGKKLDCPELKNAKDFGHVYAVQAVWNKLGLSKALERAGISGEANTDFCLMVRWLVFNRLCDPCSKLALMDWLEGIFALETADLSYHNLLRAMDRLIAIKDKLEPLIAKTLLGPDEPVDMVFYDITSTYFEGDASIQEDDLRRHGYSRDHRKDRPQVVIGLVMTRRGIPLCHHSFPGNTVDKATVAQVVSDLKSRFKLGRVIFVGDRGMLSDSNLGHLIEEDLGMIVAHPVRGNALAHEVIPNLKKQLTPDCAVEQFLEDERNAVRFIMAYSPDIAQQSKQAREERLNKADAWMQPLLKRLDKPSSRGRKATPQGTYDRIRDYLRDHKMLRWYHVELVHETLSVKKNRKSLNWEATVDGVLLLETSDMTMPAQDVVKHYKELAEVERGWRSLKSSLQLRPVYHWTQQRIRAHIFICVIALQLERWMRNKLHSIPLSVSKCLQVLQHIKVGELCFGEKTKLMLTALTPEDKEILKTLGVAQPTNAHLPTV